MASDTFVYWNRGVKPTKDEVQKALEDYVKGLATDVTWLVDRWFVTLPGAPSWPFQRVGHATEAQRASWLENATESDGSPRPRWFEVHLGHDNIDVITRMADEVTNNVAHGFAVLMALAWEGDLEE